ncbi:MAG: hypothetical protein U1E73_01545 [Planctomycetota bacterium]
MESSDKTDGPVERHAKVLAHHDTGDEGFAIAARRFAEAWEQLVPERGDAESGQGAVLRAVGRLASEDRRNGCMNWGKEFEAMVTFLREVLASDTVLAKERDRVLLDLDIVAHNGRNGSDPEVIRVVFGRLIQDAVAFCDAHPDPIPAEQFPREPRRKKSWWRFW